MINRLYYRVENYLELLGLFIIQQGKVTSHLATKGGTHIIMINNSGLIKYIYIADVKFKRLTGASSSP